LIEDPSMGAVALATPISTQYDVALRVLAEGKPLWVEKPLASDTDPV